MSHSTEPIADVRSATDCTVLAVVRDGRALDLGSLEVAAEDEVVVAGTDESVQRFETRFLKDDR